MRSLFASALALTTSAGALVGVSDVTGLGIAQAQTVESETIARVLVEGNQRIESRTVQSYMLVEPGDPFDPERIDLSLKTLFSTQLFADVLIERRENDLVVRVSENPIINQVLFEGNRSIREDKLREETEAAPREVFTQARVQQDVQRILEVYRRAGRFAVSVTPTYKPLAQNRVDLIFEISEGPKTGVRSINFIGNEKFDDDRLRGEIVTRQSRWWRFFESNDNYDPNRLEYDRELLRQFYTNEGYADFRVTSSVAELTPDQEDFYITFTIDEGSQYDFGEIKVETALEKISSERLELILPIRSGQLYRSKAIENAIDTITFAAGTAGYASVDVRPRIERNRDTQTVDITFVVDEGPRVYVERLDIVGNTQTLDRVIRRELKIAEGDAFNRILIDQSRNRIRQLGFFKEVEITEEPGSSPDRTVVRVEVEEQPTGELAFSAGFSSADSFLFSVSATQRNFRGRGQAVSAIIQTTSRQQDYQFRFTEPKFQDRNLAVGLDLFATEFDYLDIAGYSNASAGGGLRMGFPLADRTQLGLRYNLRRDDVTVNNEETVCAEDNFFRSTLCDQLGQQVTSALGYSLNRDRRNDPIEPTGGYYLSWSQDAAGLGGDVHYLRNELRGTAYKGLWPGITLSGTLSAGLIEGWNGDDIRVNNRFFKGGNSFRGFDVAGLGPREVQYVAETENQLFATGDTIPDRSNQIFTVNDDGDSVPATLDGDGNIAVAADGDDLLYSVLSTDGDGQVIETLQSLNAQGGKFYGIGALELTFPIPYAPDELGISGAFFTEFGTLGGLDDRDRQRAFIGEGSNFNIRREIADDASLRASVGVSVFWDSPFGPIRFDFSEILAKEEYDRTESFRFSTRTQF